MVLVDRKGASQRGDAEAWRLVRLGDVAEVVVSSVDKKSRLGELPVQLCNYTDVYNSTAIRPTKSLMWATATPAEVKRFLLNVGDVVITKDSEDPSDIAVPALVEETSPNLVCGYHLAIVRPGPDVNSLFLKYYFDLPRTRAHFGARANGITRFGLTVRSIAGAKVQIPTLSEQVRIAEALRTWDLAVEMVSKLRGAKQLQQRGLLQRVIRQYRGPNAGGTGWQTVRLGDVAAINSSNLSATNSDSDMTFRYITLSDVVVGGIVGPLRKYSPADAPTRAKRVVAPGDILISTVRPNLQGFAMVGDEHHDCIASTAFAVASPNSEVLDSRFLFHYMFSWQMQSQLKSLVVGSNYPAVTPMDVRRLRVSLPSLAKQKRIADMLDGSEADASLASQMILRLRCQKRGLMQRLFVQRVRC